MKNSSVITLLLILVVVGGVSYVWLNQKKPALNSAVDKLVETSPVPDQFIKTSPDTSGLRAGGSSFSDQQGVFTFLYPNDYTLDTENNGQHTRIYKRGATQQGQTEIYDGVLMVFEAVDLQGKSLGEWVDSHIQESTADGTAEITQPKKETALKDYSGFTYEVRSLGTSTNLVLQKDPASNHAVNINFMISDPNNQNYQGQVDSILSTLELLK